MGQNHGQSDTVQVVTTWLQNMPRLEGRIPQEITLHVHLKLSVQDWLELASLALRSGLSLDEAVRGFIEEAKEWPEVEELAARSKEGREP